MRDRAPHRAILLLIGSTLVALALAFLLPYDLRRALYLQTSVPWSIALGIVTLAVLLLVFARSMRAGGRMQQRRTLVDMTIAAVLIALMASLVPARHAIETDESQYFASADAIRFTGGVLVPSSGLYGSDGVLHPTTVDIHKRGEIYPLLQAAASLVLGDDAAANAADLNLLAGWGLLVLLMQLLRSYGFTTVWVALAAVCLLSFPVVAVTIRSGMYDVLNTLLLMTLTVLLRSSTIDSAKAWSLVLVAAVLAQIRMESLVVAGVVVLAVHVRCQRQNAAAHPSIHLSPLIVVAGCWRLAIPINMELPADVTSAWGLSHLWANVMQLLEWLLLPTYSGNCVIAILGLLAVPFWWARRGMQKLPWATGLPLITLPVLLYSYWGQADNPVTVRYFVPLTIPLVIAATWLLRELAYTRPMLRSWTAPAAWLLVVPLVMQTGRRALEEWPELRVPAHRDAVLASLDARYGRCNVLLVSHLPILFITRDRGAIFPGDWDRLAHRVAEWAPALGIHAIVAISLRRGEASSQAGFLTFDGLPDGPAWTAWNAVATTDFREIWLDQAEGAGCQSMVRRTGVDLQDLRSALHLWELQPHRGLP